MVPLRLSRWKSGSGGVPTNSTSNGKPLYDRHRTMTTASLEKCMDEEFAGKIEVEVLRTENGELAADNRQRDEGPVQLATGRHIGTPAPMESTEVLVVQGMHPLPEQVGSDSADSAASLTAHEQAAADAVGKLADSARNFMSAIRELAEQSATWGSSVRQQLSGLQTRFDQLAEVVSAQQAFHSAAQEKYAQLSADVSSLREAGTRHAVEAEGLRAETRERADWFSRLVEELSARLKLHQEDSSGLQLKVESLMHLQSTVSDLSSKVAVWSDRLDRQGDALQSLCEIQANRTVALDLLLEGLTRLKASILLPSGKL
jgi:DNA repair exonuclease SbcCD ATPase subunit